LQRSVEPRGVDAGNTLETTPAEVTADHGRGLQQLFLAVGKSVDARAE